MATQSPYHIELTGFVGGDTFRASAVRGVLARHHGTHVDVLIDSFGGSLSEGLSICGAFRDHGDVTVHLRGMNASAATIASMGARHISMAPEAMYLVHKVSMPFFDWASRNSDQIARFIEELESTKEDLDTMDRSVAKLYADRCKKECKDLLDLMKAEKWLDASQALEWGFVDEVVGKCGKKDGKQAKLTRAQAWAFDTLGLPLPPVEVESESKSLAAKITEYITQLIHPDRMENEPTAPQADAAPQQQEQPSPQPAAEAQHDTAQPQAAEQPQTPDLESRLAALESRIEALSSAAAPGTTAVVAPATPAPAPQADSKQDPVSAYCTTAKASRDLFNSLP